ncbi:SDR family oxidoreductase [Micromonospora sp. DR5-3]|uniref:SDR family NAD(P)-dependent oxidoreductase n=1 Tax=unclassified Micromonospora TaxID=2617518 RepID=UPI0011D3A89D|nr:MULTISPECIES: SDR family oxidoreductase [unclassified Micromonospora]MCW3819091.1 SDR family oxidoreductase [Micromonospora sp. DR5-3]TYC20362.1 SDR family oxidoreductase [Micromonospora sp. MP36]
MSVPQFGFTPGDVVLVTGAGSGIGRAIATRAAEMGLAVAAVDLDPAGAGATVERIERSGGRAVAITADASDPGAVAAAFARARELGVIRYLVNNAGPSSAVELEFDEALRIAIGSVRRVTDTWLTGGAPEGAALVNIASVAGNLVGTASDWYCAAKAAIMGYTRHLAAYRSDEVRSNAVAPGMTDTPRLAGFAESEVGQRVLGRIPLHRMATPDDIAYAVLFLLSPLASYVNGVFLPVDGGWTVTQ